MNNFQSALNYYDEKLKTEENSYYHQANGSLYRHQHNLKQATIEFQASIQENPCNIAARNDLALTLAQQKKYQQSTDELKRAVIIHPTHPILHGNLSAVLAQTGNYNEALSHAKYSLSTIQTNLHHQQQLPQQPQRSQSQQQQLPIYHRNIAKLYDIQGDQKMSLQHNKIAINLESKQRELLLSHKEQQQQQSQKLILSNRLQTESTPASAALRKTAVQLIGQHGGIDEALDYMRLARQYEHKPYIPKSSQQTHELIYSIKRQYTNKTPVMNKVLIEKVQREEDMKLKLDRIKQGYF